MKIKKNITHLYRSPKYEKLRLWILSFALACIAWLYITAKVSPSMMKSFQKVPIIASDVAGTKAESYGLMPMLDKNIETPTVEVVIQGKRTAIGGLTKRSDIEAYVDYNSAIDRVGKQTLPIKLRRLDGTTISNCTLTPSELEVELDRYQTMSVNAKVDITNLAALDNIQIDEENVTCEPAALTVRGPSQLLAKLDHVRVRVTNVNKIDKNQTYEKTSYELVDIEGNVMDVSALNVQAANFIAHVPVYYLTTLPATIDITGSSIPQNFDMDSLRKRLRLVVANEEYMLPEFGEPSFPVELKTSDITKKALLDSGEPLNIGQVSLSALSCGGERLPVMLSPEQDDDIEVLTNLDGVYVTIGDTDGLVARECHVKISKPSYELTGFNVQVQTKEVVITLVGDAKQINAISPEDIYATVNLGNEQITEPKTFQKTVSITLPSEANMVWIYGTPKATVTVTEKKETDEDT